MASPFPGMDPYLESPRYWSDFHSRFINYWCEAVADLLPDEYEASLGERVYLIEHEPEARKLTGPDIAIDHRDDMRTAETQGSADSATLAPVTIPLEILDGPREAYIEILHQPDQSLVAILELLSPTNKELPGRREYLAKRRAILTQQVHLVELDLLLRGRRLPLGEPLPPGDCHYLVSRGERRPDCQVYSWRLRDPLPRLPVPLQASDRDIFVDLGAVFSLAYERGRFARRINYQAPCPAPLREEDRVWAESVAATRS